MLLAQFEDDPLRSRLRTFLSLHTPSEVLLERGQYTPATLGVINLLAPTASIDYLRSGSEMPNNGRAVMQSLLDKHYFSPSPSTSASSSYSQGSAHNSGGGLPSNNLPSILQALQAGLGDGSSDAVVCAFGGALWQLQRSLIDYEVMSLQKFFGYVMHVYIVVFSIYHMYLVYITITIRLHNYCSIFLLILFMFTTCNYI